jgi:hypothetical protein
MGMCGCEKEREKVKRGVGRMSGVGLKIIIV